MQLKNIVMLSVAFCTTVDAQFSIALNKWRAASPDSFIAQETVRASSDIVCASIATKKRWVNLFKYENNICQLSDENRIPSSDPQHGDHVKSKHSPDDCLLSNGSVVGNGQEVNFPDCAIYVCENSDLIVLAEPNYASSCVSPFSTFNGGCYHFVSTPKTWCDARRDCFRMGSDLINVYGMLEPAMNAIVAHYGLHSWVGIKSESSEVGFLFMSTPGKPSLSISSTLWYGAQPDELMNDACGFVFNTIPGFYDYPCSVKYTYICEIPLV